MRNKKQDSSLSHRAYFLMAGINCKQRGRMWEVQLLRGRKCSGRHVNCSGASESGQTTELPLVHAWRTCNKAKMQRRKGNKGKHVRNNKEARPGVGVLVSGTCSTWPQRSWLWSRHSSEMRTQTGMSAISLHLISWGSSEWIIFCSLLSPSMHLRCLFLGYHRLAHRKRTARGVSMDLWFEYWYLRLAGF